MHLPIIGKIQSPLTIYHWGGFCAYEARIFKTWATAIEINGSILHANHGMPQGSILAFFLFVSIILINCLE